MRRRRGFILLLAALSLVVLLGAIGLALDGARLFAVRNEARSFADLAALTAARELDGSPAGLDRSRLAVARLPGYWSFGSERFDRPTVDFTGSDPKQIRRVRVTASSGPVAFLFAAAVAPFRETRVTATAVAEASGPFNADAPLPLRAAALPDGEWAAGTAVTLTPVLLEGDRIKLTPGLDREGQAELDSLRDRTVAVAVYGPPREPRVIRHVALRLTGGLTAIYEGPILPQSARLVE